MKKRYIIPFIFIGLVTACKLESPENGRGQSDTFCIDEDFEKKITFSEAKLEEVKEAIHLTGSVEVNPDKEIHFSSLVSGLVVNTFFSLGDKVQKGQLLIEMRSAELSLLQAELASIRAQIKVAERELISAKSMFEQGLNTEKDYLQAQSELISLQANENRINSDLALYHASSEKGVFQIKAPQSGIVTAKNVNSGMTVSASGELLFSIADLHDVWVMADVFSTNVQHIQAGMKVRMTTSSYEGKVFVGEVATISSVLDEASKVLKARIVLNNDEQLLKPGMLIDLHALKEANGKAIAVPTSALVFSDNQNYVVVYKAACDVEVRKVTIQAKNQFQTYISDGLKAGEKIISTNQLLVFEAIH